MVQWFDHFKTSPLILIFRENCYLIIGRNFNSFLSS
ncbi:unnamed protein product [Spirodela intermedia]|uniref:Uncharacterized protein n=1 Tax=Spirodela intermedia TaxID=51605 RepID=A0A7I8JCF3_SPIIN|nr:unnamed protein product [Spirodela intermedia]CAA6667072.1 unnamed protein product [Spirodela intermedia]